jgi:G3E family GTPase
MVILNKVGLAGPEQVEKVRAWLDDHFNRLRVVETDYCDVPNEILLGVGRFDPSQASAEHDCSDPACNDEHAHPHSDVFGTWSYETDKPLALDAVRDAMRKLPGSVYRAKGVVYTADAPDRRAVLQVVGRRVDIAVETKWGDRPPRTRIVAIGQAGEIGAALLEDALASCVSPAQVS